MRSKPQVAVFLVLALVAGCSKALAPDARTARDAAGGAARSRGTRLKIVGSIVTLDPVFQPRIDRHVEFFVAPSAPGASPRDTVPARSTLGKVQWGALAASASSRNEDPEIVPGADASAPIPGPAARSPEVLLPGTHLITFEAPDRAGGGTVSFFFQVNFSPDTWWAGPDPARWPASRDGDGRAVDVTNWNHFTTEPAWPPDGRGYFGPDSFSFIPSARRPVGDDFERRTFYEIYGDRIYARSEGDTVHLNSWIVICSGGYDKDSKYMPRVVANDPALPPDFATNPGLYPVLHDQGLAGSPIGFRMAPSVRLADGTLLRFARSVLYPTFDPNSVFRATTLAGYFPARLAGKVYLVAQAEDSDGSVDLTISSAADVADRVDAGGGTPEERLYRRKVLVFHVRPAASPQL